MTDVIAAEWLKMRSVRSTYALLALLVVMLAGAWAIDSAMVAAWDTTPPAQQATFESADLAIVVAPLTQFLLALLAALAITAEYRTGAILTTLTAVPDRRRLLAAKTVVLAALTTTVAATVTTASALISTHVAGDRPAPIQPWTSAGQATVTTLALIASILVAALVGLGLGAALRSTAGALGAVTGLLFIAPVLAAYLPDPWNHRVAGVLLPSLAPQLAGTAADPLLGPAAAGTVLVLYAVLALGAGALVLTRRDA